MEEGQGLLDPTAPTPRRNVLGFDSPPSPPFMSCRQNPPRPRTRVATAKTLQSAPCPRPPPGPAKWPRPTTIPTATPHDPRRHSQNPATCALCPAHAHHPGPHNAHVPPPYQMFLPPAKTLSARSWCLMPNNQAAGPTTKIAVESLFRIRPQTCSPSAGARLFTFPSLPCHAVLCFLQRV